MYPNPFYEPPVHKSNVGTLIFIGLALIQLTILL